MGYDRIDPEPKHDTPYTEPARLDDRGRCCGRKPIDYKGRWHREGPHRFCCRCCRSYNRDTGIQIDNWAWKLTPAAPPPVDVLEQELRDGLS